MALQQPSIHLDRACLILFGEQVRATPDFLRCLKPEGVKAAFRTRALETHPDRAAHISGDPAKLNQNFIEVVSAYEAVMNAIGVAPPPPTVVQPAPARPQARPARTRRVSHFFRGALPGRNLRLGEFLYYSGIISWQTFIDSLLWQRKSRPSFGDIAKQWNLLDQQSVFEILKQRHYGEKFGESAVRLGKLKPFWVRTVLKRQGKLQPLLGEFFLQESIMDQRALLRELARLERHNHKSKSFFSR